MTDWEPLVENWAEAVTPSQENIESINPEQVDLTSSQQNLSDLNQNDVVDYTPSEDEKKLIDSIDNSAGFQPPETLRYYIEHKERSKAITELFNIIWRFLSSGGNDIWFNEFKNLDIASLKLDEKSESELESLITHFEKKIEWTSDIAKDLKFTYLLSAVKNKLYEKKDSVTDKEQQLGKSLAIGDVILLNKKVDNKDIWTRLLEAYDPFYDTDFWHAAIVIWLDPIKVRHSTTSTSLKKSENTWFVEDVDLNSYLSKCQCKWYDLLALRPSEDIKNKILSFSEKNLWKEYDSNAAIWWWITWSDRKWKSPFDISFESSDDYFNCVEIIAQALDQDKLKNITHPNEFLEYMDVFKPVYMTTIEKNF